MGFLTGNWKMIAAGFAVVAIFTAGWKVNGWRYEAEYREAELAIFDEIAERRAVLLAEFEDLRQGDDLARAIMATDLAAQRARADQLASELESASLVKTETEIVVQWRDRVVTEDADEICGKPVLANPFGAEFVRLFNESADQRGGPVPGADTT